MESQLKLTPQDNEVGSSSTLPTNSLTEWAMTEEVWQRQVEQKEGQIQKLTLELAKANDQLQVERAERERWAQFLHDAINQSLFSAGLIAEVLPRLWERDQAAARKSLEDLRRLTFGAIAEMRVLLTESRPSLLRGSDLGDLLSLLGNMVAGRLNIPVNVETDQKIKLPPDVQSSIYYLCKEILHRIIRHASASQIDIKLIQGEPYMEIHSAESGNGAGSASLFNHADEELISALNKAKSYGVELQFGCQLDKRMQILIRWQGPVENSP